MSLPADYAILSHYTGSRGERDTDQTADDHYSDARSSVAFTSEYASPRILRRSSFPTSYLRPPVPFADERVLPKSRFATENSPLLGPLVPRIDEETNRNASHNVAMIMFWEELHILTRYTIPVFG